MGKVRLPDGRWFDTGLPNGFSDLFGFEHKNNQIFFIEVKNKTGRIRQDQIAFHNFLQKHRVVHGIARNADDALAIVDNSLVGYGYE